MRSQKWAGTRSLRATASIRNLFPCDEQPVEGLHMEVT